MTTSCQLYFNLAKGIEIDEDMIVEDKSPKYEPWNVLIERKYQQKEETG